MLKKFRIRDLVNGRTVADFTSARAMYEFIRKFELEEDTWSPQYWDVDLREWVSISVEELEQWKGRRHHVSRRYLRFRRSR